ncbi:MAG: hypothetical protein LBU13_00780 [Synergistaceae bacterium]|nr:hypothetical protein [Synergistaceae bacterium]
MSVKEQAYAELREKANMLVHGIRITDETAAKTGAGVTVKEGGREGREKPTPANFRTPLGFNVAITANPDSDYAIEYAEGRFLLTKKGHLLYDHLEFERRPQYYARKTTDGKWMKDIVSLVTNGCAAIWYSNECAFKYRDEGCLFCDINCGPGNIFMKTSAQIAESVKAAFDEGVAWRIDFTGGVIPQRREITYYTDAIRAIIEALGRRDLVAAACIAAPRDLAVIEQVKEAGFSIITMNIEIWDKNIFRTFCPGKDRTVGWDNWVKALEFAAKIFGFGQVRCNFVTGFEPQHKTLEGIEYLASIGVIGNANIFHSGEGTPLEGHRCPTPEWNLQLHERAADILRASGVTFAQAANCHPMADALYHDFWRIKDDLLPALRQSA